MSLETVWRFISYWYFRYLMVTELYMVEKWERNVINSAALIFFCIFWYFNATYVVSRMSDARSFIGSLVSLY